MKPEHVEYILENIDKKSVGDIAKDINVKPRKVKKIIEKYRPKTSKKQIPIKKLFSLPSIDVFIQKKNIISYSLVAILIIAALFRSIYLFQIQDNPIPASMMESDAADQYRFMELVKEFTGGNWLGSQVTRFSPVYSYLIAAIYAVFGQNINYLYFFQILLGIMAVYIFYRSTSLLFKNKKVGLIAAFFAAFYSPFIFYECCVLRASIIAYTNLFAFYFLLRALVKNKAKYFFIAGVMTGVSMIMRPNLLPLFIVPYIAVTIKNGLRSKITYALLFIFALILVIAPLSIRNKMLDKDVLISFQGPSSFWIGNTYDAKGIGLSRSPLREKLASEAHGSVIRTFEILLREIKEHPREYKELYLRKVKMFLNGYEIPANLNYYLFRKFHNVLKIAPVSFAIICPLALLGLVLVTRKYKYIGLLYLFLLVPSVSVIFFHIQSRYRIPAVPFFIIFASYTVYWLVYMLKTKKFVVLSSALAVLMGISFYTRPDKKIIEKYFGSYIRGVDYNNLASAYIKQMNREDLTPRQRKELMDKVVTNLEMAVLIDPRDPRIQLKLGAVYYLLGRYEDAEKAFYRTLESDPTNEEAMKYIADIQRKQKF